MRLPYHLSALTQAAALGALAHSDEMLAMVDEIRGAARPHLRSSSRELGFRPYRSGANFVLFGGVDDPHAVFEALLERGILIRDIGLPGCLRVTAGTEAETTAFLEAIAAFAPRPSPAAAGTPNRRDPRIGWRHDHPGTPRTARVQRETSESSIDLSLELDGTGTSDIETTVPFYDHLLTAFAKHSLTDLTVRARGDIEIDVHHTVEDVGIVLGQAIREALGDKRGISRYGDALVPLDEALAQAVVDISGRPFLVHTGEPAGFEYHLIGGHFTGSMVRHVFEAIAFNAGLTVHVTVLGGRDPHHIAEAEFKAFARAFRQAKSLDPLVSGIPSTKGAL